MRSGAAVLALERSSLTFGLDVHAFKCQVLSRPLTFWLSTTRSISVATIFAMFMARNGGNVSAARTAARASDRIVRLLSWLRNPMCFMAL